MRFYLLAAAAAVATLASGPAVAGKKDDPADDGSKRICRTESNSGSRIASRKVCHTKDEWTQLQRERQQDADDAKESTYNRGLQPVAARPD